MKLIELRQARKDLFFQHLVSIAFALEDLLDSDDENAPLFIGFPLTKEDKGDILTVLAFLLRVYRRHNVIDHGSIPRAFK